LIVTGIKADTAQSGDVKVGKYIHAAKAISNVRTILRDILFTGLGKLWTEATDKHIDDEPEDVCTDCGLSRTHDLENSDVSEI